MNILLFVLALVAQQGPPSNPADRPTLPSDGVPERSLTPGHGLFYDDVEASTGDARQAIQGYGSCVASRSPDKAAQVLALDFKTRAYRSGLFRLSSANEDCFRRRGRMRSSNLLFAGAIAEALLESVAEPLNVRLARAALEPATPAHSATDQVAICVVRSLPDDVTRLFSTEVASTAEEQAAQSLQLALNQCGQSGRRVESNTAGLRAMLATAAFRETEGRRFGAEARN